jgi:hypothetical protein
MNKINWPQIGVFAGVVLADALGIPFAIAAIGGLTFLSGLIVATVMHETLPARRKAAISLEQVSS